MGAYQAISQAEIDDAMRSGARFAVHAAQAGRAPSPQKVEAEFLRNHRQPLALGAAISPDRARWYVVAVAPACEYRVQELLRRDRFEVWLPERIIVRPKTNDRRINRKLLRSKGPLLPGYLMARVELTDQIWHRIAKTREVHGLLGSVNKPLALRDHEVERLHAIIRKHGGIIELRADGSVKRDWVSGEAVKIIEDVMAGAWGGLRGRYVASAEDGTIKMEIDILGRGHVLQFAEQLIVPLSEAVPS